MIRWIHRRRGHTQTQVSLTVPTSKVAARRHEFATRLMWDWTSRGILVKCSCGKRWSL